MPISLFDVLARWGYSEILDGISANQYGGDVIEALRDKRRQHVDFAELTPQERYTLALQCAFIRCALLAYFVGIEQFGLANMNRFQLGHLLVPNWATGLPSCRPPIADVWNRATDIRLRIAEISSPIKSSSKNGT